MLEYAEKILQVLKEYLVDYIDIDYSLWLTWCLWPLLVTLLLPLFIVFLIYFTALIMYIYKLHWNTVGLGGDKWAVIKRIVSIIWDAHGWIMHGYEVNGMENIPKDGPALIIYYHGAIPIDIYYLLAKMILQDRLIHTVADHFLFKIPGFSIIEEILKVIPGTIQTCSNVLKNGNLLAISPGGVYEAQFSDHYSLLWKKRMGFAKVALDAKVPIIPMFTENLRESFRSASFIRRLSMYIYSNFKLPFAIIYGGFPVKLTTHIGKPIPYDPNLTPEQLQVKVLHAVEELIQEHQRIPGSICLSILERIPHFRKKIKGC